MKKTISALIIIFLLIASFFLLVSCNEKGHSFGQEEYDFYFEVLEDEKAMLISDEVTLRFKFAIKDDTYKKASIVIDLDQVCFAFEGYEDTDEMRIEYENLGDAKYKKGVSEELKMRYTGPSVSDGYVLSNLLVTLLLESDNGEERTYTHSYVSFISRGEYIAFGNYTGDLDTYLSICKKFPDWGILSNYNENPLFEVPGMSPTLVTSNILLEVAIPTLNSVPLGDSIRIDIGVGYGNAEPTGGNLKIKADGFSISGNDGVDCSNEYAFLYDDACYDKYGYKSRCDYSPVGCAIYKNPEFDHRETVTLTCNDISEHSGTIKVSASSTEVDGGYGDYNNINLYYATDGKYIAYSLESEDAAKRELYGKVGYFFKVTVHEYFADLFDGCD